MKFKYHVITNIGEAFGQVEAQTENEAKAILTEQHQPNPEVKHLDESGQEFEHQIRSIELSAL